VVAEMNRAAASTLDGFESWDPTVLCDHEKTTSSL
jgi:hypothetical protein